MRTGSLLDRRITVHLPATGAALVVGIIATGSWLLWTQGAHWGQPFGFNPDEYRYLTRIVNDPSVAFWTTYGRWPIYFQRIAAGLTGTSMSDLVLARQLSALVSCAGLIAAALSSRKISGGFGAVLTIASLAGAPSVVQSAHFFITDVWLYVGVTFTILFCLQTLENTGWPTTVALGVSWGIATGSKLSGVFLLPAVFLAYAFSRGYHRRWKLVGACILAASITLLGQPTLLAYGVQAYLRDGALLSTLRVIAGAALPAYTLQFANTPAWTYYFTHLLWYGAGPFLLVAGSAGGILAIAHALRRRHFWRVDLHLKQLMIVVIVFTTFYLMSAGQHDKYTRYILPLLPPLAIMSGWLFATIFRRLNEPLWVAATVAVVMIALLPGLMYSQIYTRPDTRLQAAEWIGQNIPAGSIICHEPDLGFAVPPVGLGGPAYMDTAARNYQGVLLDWGLLYNASDYLREHQSAAIDDTPQTQAVHTQLQQQRQIQSWLTTCDWIILSDRFADQYVPLPIDFEAISAFYSRLLADHDSDFQKAAEFRSLPGLVGLMIDDRGSELTFRSFDHPTIWIFQRRSTALSSQPNMP